MGAGPRRLRVEAQTAWSGRARSAHLLGWTRAKLSARRQPSQLPCRPWSGSLRHRHRCGRHWAAWTQQGCGSGPRGGVLRRLRARRPAAMAAPTLMQSCRRGPSHWMVCAACGDRTTNFRIAWLVRQATLRSTCHMHRMPRSLPARGPPYASTWKSSMRRGGWSSSLTKEAMDRSGPQELEQVFDVPRQQYMPGQLHDSRRCPPCRQGPVLGPPVRSRAALCHVHNNGFRRSWWACTGMVGRVPWYNVQPLLISKRRRGPSSYRRRRRLFTPLQH